MRHLFFSAIAILAISYCNIDSAIAQNYEIADASTQSITNFSAKYTFQNVGAYDLDLKEWRTDHPPYREQVTVVININPQGTGTLGSV